MNRIIDWQADISDPAAFMGTEDRLEQAEVFVSLPRAGHPTPVGSTSIDFAYGYTDVGHTAWAKVNGGWCHSVPHFTVVTRARFHSKGDSARHRGLVAVRRFASRRKKILNGSVASVALT